jgi:hypothetical protein
MSDQDDWEFSGGGRHQGGDPRCEVLPTAFAAISCRRSFQSCAKSQMHHHLSSRIPWTMVCPAADRRTACALSTGLA